MTSAEYASHRPATGPSPAHRPAFPQPSRRRYENSHGPLGGQLAPGVLEQLGSRWFHRRHLQVTRQALPNAGFLPWGRSLPSWLQNSFIRAPEPPRARWDKGSRFVKHSGLGLAGRDHWVPAALGLQGRERHTVQDSVSAEGKPWTRLVSAASQMSAIFLSCSYLQPAGPAPPRWSSQHAKSRVPQALTWLTAQRSPLPSAPSPAPSRCAGP